MIRGELGMVDITKIAISKYKHIGHCEMTIYTKNGSFIHIIGDEDLDELLKDALKNIIEK